MPLIDFEVKKEMEQIEHDNCKNLFVYLSRLFAFHSYSLVCKIKISSSNRDYQELFTFSHEMKGMALSIGAIKLSYFCNMICRDIESENYKGLDKKISKLIKTYNKTILIILSEEHG